MMNKVHIVFLTLAIALFATALAGFAGIHGDFTLFPFIPRQEHFIAPQHVRIPRSSDVISAPLQFCRSTAVTIRQERIEEDEEEEVDSAAANQEVVDSAAANQEVVDSATTNQAPMRLIPQTPNMARVNLRYYDGKSPYQPPSPPPSPPSPPSQSDQQPSPPSRASMCLIQSSSQPPCPPPSPSPNVPPPKEPKNTIFVKKLFITVIVEIGKEILNRMMGI